MKDTGKTIHGVKVYTDPEVPPNQIFLLNGNFVNKNPRRTGTLTGVTKITWKERLMIFWWVIPLAIILTLLFIAGGKIGSSGGNIPIPVPVYTYQMYHGSSEE